MAQQGFDRLWEPSTLSRIGGGAQGGSTKTPRERAELDRQHEGRDLDRPEGALPPQQPAPPQRHPAQVHPKQEHVRQEHPTQVHVPQKRT